MLRLLIGRPARADRNVFDVLRVVSASLHLKFECTWQILRLKRMTDGWCIRLERLFIRIRREKPGSDLHILARGRNSALDF